MENTGIDPQIDPQTQVDGGSDVIDGGNLPSAQDDLTGSLEKFQLNDEFVAKNFKNGKLFGRFDSLEAVLNTLHSVETKYSNVMRDIKSSDGQQTEAQPQTQEVNIQEIAQPVIEKFVANDFNYEGLDNEIAQLAEQTGKSVAEIKLAALEIKEQVTKAYNIVGGKEEYNQMLSWAKSSLSDEQKADFDKALNSNFSAYAIKGLYAEYKSTVGGEPAQRTRIEGDGSGNVGVRGYSTFQELSRDRAYLLTPQGRSDRAAQELHRRRLNLTSDNVIYNR